MSYKAQVAASFDRRKSTYDASPFHQALAQRLLELADLRPGEHVLDVATGTGLVAVPAAQLVGAGGSVTGIDLSAGMSARARESAAELGLTNVFFEQGDADTLELQRGRFDTIFCCSALIYLADVPRAVKSWHRALKPGGRLAFTCFADTAFLVPKLLRETAAAYGAQLPNPNAPCGSRARCEQLVSEAGFRRYDIVTEPVTYTWRLPNAEAAWPKTYGPFDGALARLEAAALNELKPRYLEAVETLLPDGEMLEPVPTFFVSAYR